LYSADQDEQWMEHELDYILFAIKNSKFTPNLNEVSETKWISRTEFDRFIE